MSKLIQNRFYVGSEILSAEEEFDFDNYDEAQQLSEEKEDGKPGSAAGRLKVKKPKNKAEEEMERQALLTPEALAHAEREKEANALVSLSTNP